MAATPTRRICCPRVSGSGVEPTRRSELASDLIRLGVVTSAAGDFDGARAAFEEAVELGRQLDDKRLTSSALNNLGEIARLAGELAAAREYYEESLELELERNSAYAIALRRLNLGGLALEEGDDVRRRAARPGCARVIARDRFRRHDDLLHRGAGGGRRPPRRRCQCRPAARCGRGAARAARLRPPGQRAAADRRDGGARRRPRSIPTSAPLRATQGRALTLDEAVAAARALSGPLSVY